MNIAVHPSELCAAVHLEPYSPTPDITATIAEIVTLHRLRQNAIKAQTKLSLQGQAVIRLLVPADETPKEKAKARYAAIYKAAATDPTHDLHDYVAPYLHAGRPLDEQRAVYERQLVKAAKRLPVYPWVKSVRGFGDISFATIVGECGDIGTYKSVSAVWKRLGLAVIDGNRQGNPGKSASADDWIAHGYNRQRRSVSWNMRANIIGAQGMWRPLFGESVRTNHDLTLYQQVFAERARMYAGRLDVPVAESAKGKESYSEHVVRRAARYAEKLLIKHLYLEWRRTANR